MKNLTADFYSRFFSCTPPEKKIKFFFNFNFKILILKIKKNFFSHLVARKMKMKEKQKKRKAYEPKLTQEELMDSSTFKRFLASIDNILENLEDVDFTTMGKYQY